MEKACAPKLNTGMFAAMKEAGDVMGVFVGHDHDNDYAVMWKKMCIRDRDLAEEFIKYCVKWALDNCADDVKFLNDMFDKGPVSYTHLDVYKRQDIPDDCVAVGNPARVIRRQASDG